MMNKKRILVISLVSLMFLLVGVCSFLVAEGVSWLLNPSPRPSVAYQTEPDSAESPARKMKKGRAPASIPGSLDAVTDAPSSWEEREPASSVGPDEGTSFFYSESRPKGRNGGFDRPEANEAHKPKAPDENPIFDWLGEGSDESHDSGSDDSSDGNSDGTSSTSTASGDAALETSVGGLSPQPTANGYTVSATMGAQLDAVQGMTTGGYNVKLGFQSKSPQ